MDDLENYDVIESREFDLVFPNEKGILGQYRILKRKEGKSEALEAEKRIVTFVIEAGPDSPIRGTELFNRMLDYFGDDVKLIHGTWRKNLSGALSTNIDKVNELTLRGISLDDAIQFAWTVTRARKRGFGRACVLGKPDGMAGAYIAIDVEIRKEP